MLGKFPIAIALLLTTAFATTLFGQGDLTEEELTNIRVPMDPTDPVFVYDSVGGLRIAPANDEATPRLRIYPDGRAVTGGSSKRMVASEKILTESELNQFLNFVVNQNKIYEIKSEDLKAEIDATGKKLLIADASSSHFKLHLQRGDHEVQLYALLFAAKKFDIEGIKQLREIETRSLKMIATVNLGSDEQVAELLKQVNAKFLADHPDVPPIVADDVQHATHYADGQFRALFSRQDAATKDQPARKISVGVVRKSSDAELELSIKVVNSFGKGNQDKANQDKANQDKANQGKGE